MAVSKALTVNDQRVEIEIDDPEMRCSMRCAITSACMDRVSVADSVNAVHARCTLTAKRCAPA